MSNNYNTKNNNVRTNNNRRGNSNNFNKKVTRHPKVNPNEIKATLILPADLNENIADEIVNVLSSTKFNKISIPLGTYRWMIDSNVAEDDTRVCTIGFIRDYNTETAEFTVVIFSKFIETIKEFKGDNVMPAIKLQFTTYKESLGSITKFNIIPVMCTEESADEVTKEVTEEVTEDAVEE